MAKKALLLTIALLCSVAQEAWALDGGGASTGPCQIVAPVIRQNLN